DLCRYHGFHLIYKTGERDLIFLVGLVLPAKLKKLPTLDLYQLGRAPLLAPDLTIVRNALPSSGARDDGTYKGNRYRCTFVPARAHTERGQYGDKHPANHHDGPKQEVLPPCVDRA